ncbi:protein FRA10AC1 homolog isoform X2 [Strongylocentrotus purpuratus]|uniref:Protein FRA10AC1 homolog n=1 Tax=Strongylocentrotus purpuratus TaxID=7668 RepID=A0A7M7NTA4_STRPU|nr:protein FRA10AC1 homolog isoform X2 [Strongylocentrotus purpuratus]
MDFRKTGGGYGSEFEYDSETERKKRSRQDLATKPDQSRVTGGLPSKRLAAAEYDKQESINQLFHFKSLDAYNRHKQLVNDYLLYYPGATKDLFQRDASKDKTDLDVIRENHRFLWDGEDEGQEDSWGKKLAKKYWDKLFKEYCIADLSRYKEKKIAMRWRVQTEVTEGKGHFTCGNKKCTEQEGLRTWEVNFAYMEHGEKKNALIKLRLCERCSYKLNYHKPCKEVTKTPSNTESKHRKDRDSRSPSPKRSKSKLKDKHKDKHENKHKESKHERHRSKHHKERRHRKRRTSSESEESLSNGDDQVEKKKTKHRSKDEGEGSSVSESEFWTGPAPVTEDKSREDEFDDYLKDMFL